MKNIFRGVLDPNTNSSKLLILGFLSYAMVMGSISQLSDLPFSISYLRKLSHIVQFFLKEILQSILS